MEDPYSFILQRKDGWRKFIECCNWDEHFWKDPKRHDPNSVMQKETIIPIMTMEEAFKKGWGYHQSKDLWLCPECKKELEAELTENGRKGSEAGKRLRQEILEILKEHNNV